MFLRSFTGFKDALKAGQISLVANSTFFFASSRIVSKQGYFIPKPPKSSHNSLIILQRILKQEKIDFTKQQLEDKTFALAQRQQAQEMFLKEKAAYEKARKEYLQKYEFPKRRLQPLALYVQKQMKNRGTATISEFMKKIVADYKNISEEEKQELKLLSEKDEERYQREKAEFAQRNGDLKIPEIHAAKGYTLFIEEVAKQKGKEYTLSTTAIEWNKLTKEQQEKYTIKANEISAEREKQLQQFIEKLNLNEDDVWILKKGFREDYELREFEEEKQYKIREEKHEEKDKLRRKKEAELEREKKVIRLEKQREKKATLREILAEKREKNKQKEQLKKIREKQNKLVQKEKDEKKKLLEKARLVKQKELEKKREKRLELLNNKKESLKKSRSLKGKKASLKESQPEKKEGKYTQAEILGSIFSGYPDKR